MPPFLHLHVMTTSPLLVGATLAAFADFGTPSFPVNSGNPFPATPGFSGVQGLGGDFLINLGSSPNTGTTLSTNIDLYPAISTNYRRFEDSAFDQYGYFSQGLPITATNTGTVNSTGFLYNYGTPVYAGSLFVADLASGLAINVTPPSGAASTTPVLIPVQGPGTAGVVVTTNGTFFQSSTGGIGGRIVRINQNGQVTNFAEGFNTSSAFDSTSFTGSSLSITFSADGTTLYAADNDAIWQFKTTASLAGSSAGSIVGLNDLRTLGVPYDGQNSAVDIVDTGVDGGNTNFRGRVTPGTSTTITNGVGNDDFASITTTVTTTGGGNGGGTTNTSPLPDRTATAPRSPV